MVSARLAYPRVAGMPLETRGVLAAPDPIGGGLTVWTSTQVPFAVRSGIAPVVGLPEERVRVLVPDVGGGFGVKGHVYPEEILVAAVARRLGRPVKWTETRREHCLTAAGDRDQVHEARIGVERDGRIVGIDTRFTRDHGAATTLGEAITLNTINHLPGPYRVPHYRGAGRNVVTHKTFAAAYRGAGRPEAAFVLDRLLDRAARRLGMDPAELRRRNLIRPDEMPSATGLTYRDGAPITYDPADYPAAFERLLETLDYRGWRARQAERRGGSRPIGIGLCAYVEGTGIGPFEGADIRVDPNGTVFVHLGVCAQGQGHETTLAQIAADELAVPLESVVVVGGDAEGAEPYDTLLASVQEAPPLPEPPLHFCDLCLLLYTSGTTGRSKAAMIPHRFVLGQAESVIDGLRLRPDDVLYCPYPLFHLDAAVMTVAPALLLRGVAAIGERFSVSRYWDEMRALEATVFDFMGATLTMLWKQPPGPRDRDHFARLGWGVPLPAWAPEFEQRFEQSSGDKPFDPTFYVYDATAVALLAMDRALARGGTLPEGIPAAIRQVTSFSGLLLNWDDFEQARSTNQGQGNLYFSGLTGPVILNADGSRQIGTTSLWGVRDEAIVER